MEIDNESAKRKMNLTIKAIKTGQIFFSKENGLEEFNQGCNHIHGLLCGAYKLFTSDMFPTAVFISITAIEEMAKLEIAIFRNEKNTEPAKNRKSDYLFNHKAKHSIALQEVIKIGTRLSKSIGEERVSELFKMAESGELIKMRESSLYISSETGTFTTPIQIFSKSEAKDILLLALEVWDDKLVGITEHTYKLDKDLMELFSLVDDY